MEQNRETSTPPLHKTLPCINYQENFNMHTIEVNASIYPRKAEDELTGTALTSPLIKNHVKKNIPSHP